MSKIDELLPEEIQAAREDYRWNRRYDARQGVKDSLTAAMRAARFGGDRIHVEHATMTMESVLGAVVPERRGAIIGMLIEAYDRYHPTIDVAARREAWRPVSRLLADAAAAQIAGTVFLFGGAR